MGIKCFFVEPIMKVRVSLRRYSSLSNNVPEHTYKKSDGTPYYGYHDATQFFANMNLEKNAEGNIDLETPLLDKTDPRWQAVAKCDKCGYQFVEEDEWQMFQERIYVDPSTNIEYSLRDGIPGMMWDAEYLHKYPDYCGPDGKSLHVFCPDKGQWFIDGRASNCTMKDDKVHKCWVRHGNPPNITVDKNGVTCAAGAGSIMSSNGYHGFLQNGEFT